MVHNKQKEVIRMANPLLNTLTKQMMNTNPQMQILNQFKQFKSTFQGNPQQIINGMLSSGRVTPQQYEQAKILAQQFKSIL